MEGDYSQEKDRRFWPLFSCPRKTTVLAWVCVRRNMAAQEEMERAAKKSRAILRLKDFHSCKDFGFGTPDCKKSQAEAETFYNDGTSYLRALTPDRVEPKDIVGYSEAWKPKSQ